MPVCISVDSMVCLPENFVRIRIVVFSGSLVCISWIFALFFIPFFQDFQCLFSAGSKTDF